jgi:PadR family transcriptional regulator, regulatory protein PadR
MARETNHLLHGTLDLLVLKTMSWAPMHSYGITKCIEQATKGELEILDSALYKALHRLEDAGAIATEWGTSDNSRRAKYSSLAARARQLLRVETATYKRYLVAVSGIIETG